jgi:putative CocE/NonD family hydrolase
MLTVDVRGTGASSGVHNIEYSLEETDDYRHIIEWATQQSWSSGEVFAVGISYSGTSAELMATTGHPALKAIAPLYSDFDVQMQLATPGGAYQPGFIQAWSQLVAAMDRNDLCGVIKASSADPETADCFGPELLISGVKPVSHEQAFLAQAVAMHDSPDVAGMVQQLTYRDSAWGSSEVTPTRNLPYGRKREIERSNVPMFVVTGWFDAATTNGALARFATFSNPQEVWIGAFSHGGEHDTDPYNAPDAPSQWSQADQLERVLAFFEHHRNQNGQTSRHVESTLHYYVNGTGKFRRTQVWPPQHLKPRRYYLGPDHTLNEKLSSARRFDRYIVDPTTTTAHSSRWQTQLDGADVIYDRRAEMAEKSLVYTSAGFDSDTELTGSVVLDLWMTSDQPEGVLHAYLEEVAPDGQVRYLTEGVLNLLHRKNTDNPFYPVFGPAHSFLERDARPIPTGRMYSFSTTLYATSALIKQGHKLRLSMAGANSPAFASVPAEGSPPQWNVYFGPTSPSSMTIHAAPWPEETGLN